MSTSRLTRHRLSDRPVAREQHRPADPDLARLVVGAVADPDLRAGQGVADVTRAQHRRTERAGDTPPGLGQAVRGVPSAARCVRSNSRDQWPGQPRAGRDETDTVPSELAKIGFCVRRALEQAEDLRWRKREMGDRLRADQRRQIRRSSVRISRQPVAIQPPRTPTRPYAPRAAVPARSRTRPWGDRRVSSRPARSAR